MSLQKFCVGNYFIRLDPSIEIAASKCITFESQSSLLIFDMFIPSIMCVRSSAQHIELSHK